MNDTPTLQALELAIGYTGKTGKETIASGLSFNLYPGELVGLVGGNGVGKSTLLKTICGILPPLNGSVKLSNKAIQTYNPQELSKELSIVLTGKIPASNLTVAEIIALGRQPYTNWVGTLTETDKTKVKEVIELLRLEKIVDRRSFELSDGQLQKVMLGRALAQDTSLIVLDEPTTHLDIYHKAYILKLLKDIAHTTRKTILFSTHEIDLAIQLCDQMMILTSDSFNFDQPCNLITNHCFDALFPKDLIKFDGSTGSFKIHNP